MNLKRILLSSSRKKKKFIVMCADFFSICVAISLSLLISDINTPQLRSYDLIALSFIPLIGLISFWFVGVYSSVIRFIDASVLFILAKAIFLSLFLNIVFITAFTFLNEKILLISVDFLFDTKEIAVGYITFFLAIILSRLSANYYLSERKSEKNVIIYGAGSAGIQLASALRVSKEMQPIAFIDNNNFLQDTFIGDIKVLNPDKLEKLIIKHRVDEVLIAMPSASKSSLRALLKEIEKYSVKVRILPGLAELAQGKVLVSELKEVDISDLLGRFEVEANQVLLDRNIENKVVLITGAGGSIGSEISRQAVNNNPTKVILLDSNEYALYSIKKELEESMSEVKVYSVLASVNNKKRIMAVCKNFKVDTIYHTAAYKHVPLVEENPFEGFVNNILGTKICLEAAEASNVETFVLISTDKAVRPTNIMGATKRFAELILQSKAAEAQTRMIMVRFGNVIGSSGSAIPLFQQQIKSGGPVTVTHPEVVRYFMSIPEAAELVIQAGAMGRGGDVFVLDMGEPVKIYELAKRLIKLSGMEVKDDKTPDGDIEIVFTGLRPGEKLYEELLIGDNVSTTEHKQILRAEEDHISIEKLENYIELLRDADKDGDVTTLRNILKEVVVGFTPEEEIVDIVFRQRNN